MKISLITVTYNSERTIKDTIKSVLHQTYQNIEYIIIDGNSKDKTVDIIKEYESLFIGCLKWISEPDKGIYDAMNKGIRMATGDIIGIINSDDIYFDNNVLEDVVTQIRLKNTDTIFGNIKFVNKNYLDNVVRVWKSSEFKANSFKKGWHPPHPAFFVKKEIYEKFGLFDTSFDVSADFELMLRFLEKNHVSTMYYDRFIVKMRLGGESTGSIKKIIQGNKEVLRAFKKNNIPVSFLYLFYRFSLKIIQFFK